MCGWVGWQPQYNYFGGAIKTLIIVPSERDFLIDIWTCACGWNWDIRATKLHGQWFDPLAMEMHGEHTDGG